MTRAFTARALRGRLYYLLDLTICGHTFRLASQTVAVTDADVGDTKEAHTYRGGMQWEQAVSAGMTPFAAEPQAMTVDVTVDLWGAYGFDLPAAVADGHEIGAGSGTLRLWSEVDTRSIVIVSGRLRDPAWGSRTEPLSVTIEQLPAADSGVICPRSKRVLRASWTNHDSGRNKEYYPWIFGAPSGYDTDHYSGSPAMLVDTTATQETALICGWPTYAGAEGDTVTVSNYTQSNTNTAAASHATDGNGYRVTTVDCSGFASPPIAGDNLWIAWRQGSSETFGVLGDDGGPLRNLGDLLVTLARMSRGLEWDMPRLANIRDRLNRVRVDGYIMPQPGETLSPWTWIAEYILSAAPISTHMRDGLVWCRWWEYDAVADDAVCRIVAGLSRDDHNATRITSVGLTSSDDVRTDVQVEWCYNHRRQTARYSAVLTGDPSTYREDDDALQDPWLARSLTHYGARPIVSLELPFIEDRSSAVLLAGAHATAAGPQRIIAAYSVDQYPGGMLEPGSVILLTDDDLGWSDRVALVTEATWTDGPRMQIEIEIMDGGRI